MEEYKRINTELVTEVRRMRGVIAEQERGIVQLQSQLMEERSLRVEHQRRLVELMTENFKQSIRAVNPDTTILKLLSPSENSENTIKTEKRGCSQSFRKEIRESIGMTRRRISALPLSPVRRSACIERSPGSPCDNRDFNAKDLSPLTPVRSPESDQLRVIVEAPEEVSVENQSVTPVNVPSFLCDTTRESSPHIVVQRGKRRNHPRVCEPDSLKDITLTAQQRTNIDEKNSICENEKSLSFPSNASLFGENSHILTSTPRPTLKEDAIKLSETSTPGQSLKKVDIKLAKTGAESETDDSCVFSSSRPQRSCRPVNMKEPKINAKLRNPCTSKKKRKIK